MKKALKVTFGTMLAVSSVLPGLAKADYEDVYEDILNNLAVWVEGTYTEPSNNGLSVGDQLFATSPGLFGAGGFTLDGGRRHVFLDPHHDLDYGLGLSYRWPCTHTRFFFTFDKYNNNDFKGDIDIRNIGFAPGIGQGGITQTQGVASFDVHSDEWRIGAIQDFHFGDCFSIDVLAFFEYDKVRQTVEEFNHKAGVTFSRETENRLRGWGPGVGFMSKWYFYGPYWHIFAGAMTTLLAVDNEFHQRFIGRDLISTEVGVGAPAFYIYDPDESDSLVGKLDINFGLNFHNTFRRELCGLGWDIALGMRYMNIFNAFKNGNTAFNPDAGLFIGGLINIAVPTSAANLGYPQDWGRWGPFLRFKIAGSDA